MRLHKLFLNFLHNYVNAIIFAKPTSIFHRFVNWMRMRRAMALSLKKFLDQERMDHERIYARWLSRERFDLGGAQEQFDLTLLIVLNSDLFSREELKCTLQSFSDLNSIKVKTLLLTKRNDLSLCELGDVTCDYDLESRLAQLDFDYLLVVNDAVYFAEKAVERFCSYLVSVQGAKVFYSDHDSLNREGYRSAPCFKPDWNLDYLLSYNYVGNVVGFSKAIISSSYLEISVSEFVRTPYLALLRLSPLLNPNNVCHIAEVLFHRLPKRGLYPIEDVEAVKKIIHNRYPSVVVRHCSDSKVNRLKWSIPLAQPKVTIIIPAYNALKLTRNCIESILKRTDYSNYDIMLVNNRSDDPEMLDYLSKINTLENVHVNDDAGDFNFSRINNDAVKHASGEILVFLNNDIEVISPGWLEELVSQAIRPDIGCVGAKLLFPNDTIQHGGVIVGYGGVAGHAHKFLPRLHRGYMNRLITAQNLSAVTAACMAVRKKIFFRVGGFDEENLAVAFNDVDLCLKIDRLGYRNLWTPFALLYHYESATRGDDMSGVEQERFQREIKFMKSRWETDKKIDPAYNKNLAINREDFAVRADFPDE